MATILDIISSTIITGMLLVSVMKMNITFTSACSDTNTQVITQENTTTVANAIAYDFYKIGYKTSPAILLADTSAITFVSRMDGSGPVDTIRYWLGDSVSHPNLNPGFRKLYRIRNSEPIRGSSLSVTSFSLSYYDSTEHQIPIPLGGTTNPGTLSKIRSIHVAILFQSASAVGSGYSATYWEEYISPKNLRTLM